MLLRVIWGPLELVFGALGRLLAALFVLMLPLGGTHVFQNFIGEATGHHILRRIMASRSRASSQSLYITYVYLLLACYLTLFFQILVPHILGASLCRC